MRIPIHTTHDGVRVGVCERVGVLDAVRDAVRVLEDERDAVRVLEGVGVAVRVLEDVRDAVRDAETVVEGVDDGSPLKSDVGRRNDMPSTPLLVPTIADCITLLPDWTCAAESWILTVAWE